MRIIFVFLVNFAWGVSVCAERPCKMCDNILHGGHFDPTEKQICTAILNIKNCCRPFLASNNVLGPATGLRVQKIKEVLWCY